MGWSGTEGGLFRESILPSSYAPGGIETNETLGSMGEAALTTTDAKTAILNFLSAGGTAALQSLYQVPGIKAEVDKMGVDAIKIAEKSAMQKTFDTIYTWYDANRITAYVGAGAAVLGLGFLGYRTFKGKRR